MIQLGPVLVMPAPESTAKFPADASPGSVAASAVAGQIRITRAARLNEIRDRRTSFTLFMVLIMGATVSAKPLIAKPLKLDQR